jgi:hypothetical protein
MLVRAVHAALWANAKTLSWKQLKTHAFSEAESYEMMLEAYEGESELASKPDQRSKLLKMLGLAPHIKTKTVPQPDIPQTDETASEVKATQNNHSNEIKSGGEQELLSAVVPNDESSSELTSVADDQSKKTTNGAEREIVTEDTSLGEAPPRPLKKPKAEPIRPFRRKEKRDRTGGHRRKNEKAD